MSNSLQPHGLQKPCFPVLHYLLQFAQILSIESIMLSSHLILCCPLLCLQSFPESGSFPTGQLFALGGQSIEVSASGSFPTGQLFELGGQSIGVSASASVFPVNIYGRFPLGLTSLISLQSKGLLRIFPAPQLESINYLSLSLFCGQTLTSIYDYWKNHSFDQMDLCWQSNVSAF